AVDSRRGPLDWVSPPRLPRPAPSLADARAYRNPSKPLNPASPGVDNPRGTRLSVSSHHSLPGILLARNASLHIVVAGGAGMIGSHLCEELVGRGHFVTCLDNLCTGRLVNLEPIPNHSR